MFRNCTIRIRFARYIARADGDGKLEKINRNLQSRAVFKKKRVPFCRLTIGHENRRERNSLAALLERRRFQKNDVFASTVIVFELNEWRDDNLTIE